VRDLYREADLILGIGTEFSETDYDFFFNGEFALGGQLVRIDIDVEQLTRNVRPDVAILADARLAVEGLLPLLEQGANAGAERTQQVRDAVMPLNHPDYQAFLDTLLEALPQAIVMGDSTQPVYFAAAQFNAMAPRRFASAATGYGTLGYALPAAFGARLARPDLPVIAVIGDGGLQFTINELATAVEAQLGVVVLVWNNQRYEMIAQNFVAAGMAPIACDIYTPDFILIARSYGCNAHRAHNLEDLHGLLLASEGQQVPTIIELREEDFLTPTPASESS
jgi:acetolactate synthase-1/2/3 large subunit